MPYIQGIEISDDEAQMAESLGLEDFIYEEDESNDKLEVNKNISKS